ncbi:MAG: type I methionyl aminopeptidase [Chitinophagaceae bacterium]|nr:type I methionyl aminopeptidase [Chitinophagaceae bacterium]
MIYYKTNQEIELLRASAQLVIKTLAQLALEIKEGMTPFQLDAIAETFIRDHGATPAFKGFHGFPNACCISMNDAVVHGIPTNKPFENGDVISVDVGVVLQEYIGDSAYTFALGDLKPEISQLLKVTKESLQLGIAQAKAGNRVGDIGFAIQDYTEKKHHYGVVRELTGHGLGKGLHEGPEVPNYGKRGSGQKLKEGLVICIEPMINLGKKEVHTAEDDWTVLTQDGSISAHYEQTIAIKKGEPDVLANFEEIEKNIFKNKVLNNSFLA